MSVTPESVEKAQRWADTVRQHPSYFGTAEQAVAAAVLEAYPPETMEGTLWDTDQHYLAGATFNRVNGEPVDVVMFWPDSEMPERYIVTDADQYPKSRDTLTPNGKRYRLAEIGDHPAMLRTVEDYETAPIFTIVGGTYPWVKGADGMWRSHSDTFSPEGMEKMFTGRAVIRWGGDNDR